MTITYLAFDKPENAEKFVGALLDHGAMTEDISVVAREGVMTYKLDEIENSAAKGITTTTPQDATMGALAGTSVGVGVGLAAALAAVFVPGFGLVFGGGALAAALAGAAATAGAGALAGGITGYLVDLGVKGEQLNDLTRFYQEGRVIVAYAYREDGVDPDTLWTLAQKYGAAQSAPNQYAEAGDNAVVSVDEAVVEIAIDENPAIENDSVIMGDPVAATKPAR